MNITLDFKYLSRHFLKFQLRVIPILLTLSFMGYLSRRSSLGRSFGLGFFTVDAEQNIATWYASILLFSCALLLSAISFTKTKTRDRFSRHWQFLGLIFLGLSLDEAASFHEKMSIIKSTVQTSGIFYFAWVIPALALVGIFIGCYLKFVMSLRPKNRRLFCFSGFIYIVGALGFEMIGGLLADLTGKNLLYTICAHIEEGLELFGVSFFLYALLGPVLKLCP
jgi:hypothetical protein